jgi:hypothetical protein
MSQTWCRTKLLSPIEWEQVLDCDLDRDHDGLHFNSWHDVYWMEGPEYMALTGNLPSD